MFRPYALILYKKLNIEVPIKHLKVRPYIFFFSADIGKRTKTKGKLVANPFPKR
jgi:hypothetical protein